MVPIFHLDEITSEVGDFRFLFCTITDDRGWKFEISLSPSLFNSKSPNLGNCLWDLPLKRLTVARMQLHH